MPIFSWQRDLRATRLRDIFIDLRARIIAAPRLAIAEQEKWIFKRRDNWLWYPYVLRPFAPAFSANIRDGLIASYINRAELSGLKIQIEAEITIRLTSVVLIWKEERIDPRNRLIEIPPAPWFSPVCRRQSSKLVIIPVWFGGSRERDPAKEFYPSKFDRFSRAREFILTDASQLSPKSAIALRYIRVSFPRFREVT